MTMNWSYWDAYLKQGKRKEKTTDRPIGSSSHKRVVRFASGAIGLRLHATYVVTFFPDGTVAYDLGGWNTVTTFKFLNEHGPVRVWRVKWQPYIQLPNPSHSPARVRKCGKCHGKRTLPAECYGPGWCYGAYGSQPCSHGQDRQHRRETCDHGQAEGHALPDRECWRCHGAGSLDYGSKPVHLAWDGHFYRFRPDAPDVAVDGDTGAYNATAYHAYDPTPAQQPASGPDYGDARNVLARALPAFDSIVPCPCEQPACSYHHGATIPSVIIHLNDSMGWSRERIADWLETLDVDLRFTVA